MGPSHDEHLSRLPRRLGARVLTPLRLTEAQFRSLTAGKGIALPRAKFGNKKTSRDNVQFDSTFEAQHYEELKVRMHCGEVRNLELQVTFELKVEGVLICKYVADFVYEERGDPKETLWGEEPTWRKVVEDTKSPPTRKTRDYRIKSKLMAVLHQPIREVMRAEPLRRKSTSRRRRRR